MLETISPGEEQRLLVLKAITAMRAGYVLNRPDGISEWRWKAMIKHLGRDLVGGSTEPVDHAEPLDGWLRYEIPLEPRRIR